MTEYRLRLQYAEHTKPKIPILTAANRKMDNEVLTELYEKYYAKVFNTANCIVKDDEAASDIMQEVFITVWQKYEALREKEKVGAWITTITVNKCKEYLRKQKREAAAFSDIFDDEDSSFEETIADEDRSAIPDEAVMDKQIKETLASLINELPEKQRMCMLMYYGYDRKISEIAETLEIPESTVKSCLNYGKKKLAAKVTELEKKGYVLRGTTITVLPFLIRYLLEEEPSKKIPVSFILRSAKAAAKTGAVIAEGAAAEGAVSAAGASGAVTAGGAAASTAASTAGTAAESAASAVAGGGVKAAGKVAAAFVKFQAKSLAFKVVSGVSAAAVLVGGGAAVGSTITEKRMTENPPTAAVGEPLIDYDNLISADAEMSSGVSESVNESTTDTVETATQEAKGVLSRLFGEKETENTSQTSGAMTTKPNSRSAQTTAAESSRNSQTDARQSENKKTTAQKQTQATKPNTTEPKTTEPRTTEPHTTEPHTTEPQTSAEESTTEDEETTGRGINGKKNGDLDDDDIWM